MNALHPAGSRYAFALTPCIPLVRAQGAPGPLVPRRSLFRQNQSRPPRAIVCEHRQIPDPPGAPRAETHKALKGLQLRDLGYLAREMVAGEDPLPS
jgi:hypothetical protein